MYIEITIPRSEWATALDELLPLKIHLDDDRKVARWLFLYRRSWFELVAGKGIRVACVAELAWETPLGKVPIKFDELRFVLKPEIVPGPSGDALALSIELEESDFAALPSFVDHALMATINRALEKHDLVWNFARTLTRSVDMPARLDPVSALAFTCGAGECRVTDSAVILAVALRAEFKRHLSRG